MMRTSQSSLKGCIGLFGLSLLASFSTRADVATPTAPTFFDRYDYTSSCDPSTGGITAGDINGDGIPDLVCSSYNGVGTLFGNGDGTFRPGPTSNAGPVESSAPLLVDLNGDGKLDLISFGTATGFKPLGFYVSLATATAHFSQARSTQRDPRILTQTTLSPETSMVTVF
jgi:hypothetical protein